MQAALKELIAAVRDLSGIDDNLPALEDAMVFVYQLFATASEMSRYHGEAIKSRFGPYPAKIAGNVFNIVQRISSCQLTETVSETRSDLMEKEFGHGIKFSDNVLNVPVVGVADRLLSDVEDITDNHDMITKGLMQGMKKTVRKPTTTGHMTTGHMTTGHMTNGATNEGVVSKYGRAWLERACQSCSIQGMPSQHVYSKLLDLLMSDIEGAAMESEVGVACD